VNLKAWEDDRRIRTEAIGYLRAIFHSGKLAAAMRGRDDPHTALNAMRQLLGISDPDQLMSTIGGSITTICFGVSDQRSEAAVTRLFKEVLDLMYLVQERFKPITDVMATSFLSHLRTKLRMVVPAVPLYNTLVSKIISNPSSFVPLNQAKTGENIFNATQFEIIEMIEQQEMRLNSDPGLKKSHENSRSSQKAGETKGERGKGGKS
jgi:hypothetical protein